MKTFIALVDNVDFPNHVKVTTTAWDREVGDRVNELGEMMEVVAVGTDRDEVVGELNVLIDERNKVVRERNKKIREINARKRAERLANPTPEDKFLQDLIKDLNYFSKLKNN